MPLGMLGKYERLDVLGHGVSGIVYLAKDTLLNKQVALKEVDVQAGDLARFLEEARVMDRLRHPNIVRVNGVDRIDGKIVIDMEYIRGQNLQTLLRERGTLPLRRSLEIAAQILDALQFAHTLQTVHRDIKPANILITSDGDVKLVDFGLAEILSTNAYAGGAGTYAYMAPEDFAEEDRSDNQSDIWAVGVTLYEMLTGQRPFHVTKVKDPFAWKRVLETTSSTPLRVYLENPKADLQLCMNRALARDKRTRYQSAGEFRDDLLRIAARTDLRELVLLENPLRPDLIPDENETIPSFRESENKNSHHTGGTVVADLNAVSQRSNGKSIHKTGSRFPLLTRKNVQPRLQLDIDKLDFGSVRKGDSRSLKVQVKIVGVPGNTNGSVTYGAIWLEVFPKHFDGSRQKITLTANTESAFETGDFREIVRVQSDAGVVELPIHITVLKARARFSQIAIWFVPLFLTTLLPIAAVAMSGSQLVSNEAAMLVPSAAAASGLMSVMLMFIGIAADIGMGERAACAFMSIVMCMVLGASLGSHQLASHDRAVHHALLTGGVYGLVLLLQSIHFRKWKMWAVALVLSSIFIAFTFLHSLQVM